MIAHKQYPNSMGFGNINLPKKQADINVMDIFDALIGVGGTVVGSIGTLYATKRQEKRSDFSELVDRWKVYTDEIAKELSELREEYKTMKDQEHKCAENLRAVQYEISMLKQQVHNLGAQ
jgi:hypothetical protein